MNYLEHPLTEAELKGLLRRAGLKPQDVLRTKESAYRELVAGKELSDDEILAVMAEHPELLQRPLVLKDGKVVLARPVGNLAKLGIRAK